MDLNIYDSALAQLLESLCPSYAVSSPVRRALSLRPHCAYTYPRTGRPL